jgi:hypothetical protein
MQAGWVVLALRGPFEFSEVGVLASLAEPLAKADIGIFVISTFDTDLLLVAQENLDRAAAALVAAGHTIRRRARS